MQRCHLNLMESASHAQMCLSGESGAPTHEAQASVHLCTQSHAKRVVALSAEFGIMGVIHATCCQSDAMP